MRYFFHSTHVSPHISATIFIVNSTVNVCECRICVVCTCRCVCMRMVHMFIQCLLCSILSEMVKILLRILWYVTTFVPWGTLKSTFQKITHERTTQTHSHRPYQKEKWNKMNIEVNITAPIYVYHSDVYIPIHLSIYYIDGMEHTHTHAYKIWRNVSFCRCRQINVHIICMYVCVCVCIHSMSTFNVIIADLEKYAHVSQSLSLLYSASCSCQTNKL